MAKIRSICDLETSPWGSFNPVQALVNNNAWFVFSYSLKYKSLVSWSSNALEVIGVEDAAIARDGNIFLGHVHPDDRFALLNMLEESLKGKRPYRCTYRWIRPDTDEARWLHCRASLIEHEKDPLFEGAIIDISDELTDFSCIPGSPDSTNDILSSLEDALIILDRDLRITKLNKQAKEASFPFFCKDKLHEGKPFLESIRSPPLDEFCRTALGDLLTQETSRLEKRILDHSAIFKMISRPLLSNEDVIGIIISIVDITSQVKLEEKLEKTREASHIQLLTSAITKNLENALQTLIGQASLVKNHSDNPETVKLASQEIFKTVGQTSKLVSSLSKASSSQSSCSAPTDLNLALLSAIERSSGFFTADLMPAIMLGSPALVMTKEPELIQAIVAVLHYVRDTVAESERINIKTSDVEIEEAGIKGLPSGIYGRVSISTKFHAKDCQEILNDLKALHTKVSIPNPDDIIINDPESDKRSVLATLEELRGTVTITTGNSGNCQITFLVPTEEHGRPTVVSPPAIHSDPVLLIISHDKELCSAFQVMLKELDYSYSTIYTLEEALDYVRIQDNCVKGILLDTSLPGLEESHAVKEAKKLKNNLIIIGISSTISETSCSLQLSDFDKLLYKPVSLENLAKTLKLTLATIEAA